MKKIGLFGGTFNPVHNGHIEIAKSFLNSGYIDELWILLTPNPPHKVNQEFASFELRYLMLKEAVKDLQIKILKIENELPKPSYTYQSVAYLKEKYPNYTFFYCIGEDSLNNFHTWKEYAKILAKTELLVAKRTNKITNQHRKVILDKTIFIEHNKIDVSSSEIRNRITNNKSVTHLVPQNVLNIIKQNNLYKI